LLRRGVKVYLLRDTTKLKKLRIENNLEKNDESDAMLLSRIPIYLPLIRLKRLLGLIPDRNRGNIIIS